MSKHTESIHDLNGNIYASGLTPNQRKRWLRENLSEVSKLLYVFIKTEDSPFMRKQSLEIHKAKWKETHF